MNTLFTEPDFNTVQMLYGFVLLAAAFVAVTMPNDVVMLTGFVALLLIKDGLPNFIIGAMTVASRLKAKEKQNA